MVSGVKGVLASIPMAAAVYFIMRLIDWSPVGRRLLKGGVLGGAVVAGMAIFLVTAHLLRCEEARDALGLVKKKLFRKKD